MGLKQRTIPLAGSTCVGLADVCKWADPVSPPILIFQCFSIGAIEISV